MFLGIRRRRVLIWTYNIVQHIKMLSYNTKRSTDFDQIIVVECVLFVKGKQKQNERIGSKAVLTTIVIFVCFVC